MTINFDIALVGAGLHPRLHMTPEAHAVLREAQHVFHLTADHQYIEQVSGGKCVDLGPLYTSTRDSAVYKTIANQVLEEASACPVAFVTYGHPMVLVDSNQMILEMARAQGLNVRIVSGVSSISVMLERLALDVGLAGLQIMEANQMVALRHHPSPTMACFILQVGAFGARTLTVDRKNHPRRFDHLRDFLLKSYSPDHPIVLLTCAYLSDMQDIAIQLPLSQLSEAWNEIHTGMSLYIPPNIPTNVDQNFLDSLERPIQVFAEDLL